MQQSQVLTLAISVCALLVSLYATWERRLEIRRAQRIRLGQIAESLNEIQSLVDNAEGDIAGYNLRRELLAQQAASLARASKSRVTSVESRTIALACRNVGDDDSARVFYEASIASASREAHSHLVHALRAYADYLFTLGDVSAGRDKYHQAVERDQYRPDASSRFRLVETMAFWADSEGTTTGGSTSRAEELFKEAERLARELPSSRLVRDGLQVVAEWRDEMSRVLQDATGEVPSAVAKTPGGSGRRRGGHPESGDGGLASSGERTAAIRRWAREQGLEVSDRGRIPRKIVQAYDAEH